VPALKDQVPGQASGRALLRNSLVAAQIGLCLLLLVGAGLLVRSLQNAIRIDTGFNPRNVAMAAMNSSQGRGFEISNLKCEMEVDYADSITRS
jgi:hypothetical protein